MKYCSEASERNKHPIAEVLKQKFLQEEAHHILEIGSGTGQHAIHFSQLFPNWTWVTSDIVTNHVAIKENIQSAKNIKGPCSYEIGKDSFPDISPTMVFTANTLHIMNQDLVLQLFIDLGGNLKPNTYLCIYGPFNYKGEFTSESNEKFNDYLQETYPGGGIRNFEWVDTELNKQRFILQEDISMPANNRFLLYKKTI